MYIFLLLFLSIFLKCKPDNTVIGEADRFGQIEDRLARHLHGGAIYKRKNKKIKLHKVWQIRKARLTTIREDNSSSI